MGFSMRKAVNRFSSVMTPYIPAHLLVAASAWVSRIVTALIQIAIVRILLNSLGLENYAVFMLLTGLVGWFALADMGIGVSVQNYISELRAENQPYHALIATVGMLAVLLLFGTVIALYFISPHIAPLFLKQFSFLSDAEKTKLFFLTGALSIGFGVGGIIYKVWYAEQKGYLSNIVPAVASGVGFIGLLLVRQAPVGDRLFLSLTVFMTPTAFLPLAALVRQQLMNGHQHYLGTEFFSTVLQIMKRGLRFWLFALMAAGVLQVDYIVMSQFLDSHAITSYSISTKVFSFAFFIYSAILLALWPIFAEHIARRQWDAIRQYLKKYLIFGFAFMFVCTALLVWLMPVAVRVLAPKENIVIPLGFILLLGAYQMLRVWTDTFSTLLLSMNDLAPFWILVPLQALISVGLQWILAPRFGIYGIVWGLIGSFVCTVTWGLPLAARRNYRLGMREVA